MTKKIKEGYKECTKCKKSLPSNTDYFHRKEKGLTSSCKVCEGTRYTRFLELKDGEMYCKKCNEILPYTEEYFPIDKSTKDGLRKTCLICSGRKSYGKRRKLILRELKDGEQRNRKPTIEDVREFSKNLGGECLEDNYINSKTPMKFKCSVCDKTYEKTYLKYKKDNHSRCIPCNRKHSTELRREKVRDKYLKEVQGICEEIGLKLLSKEFDHPHADLSFECSICKESFKRRYYVLKKSMTNHCNKCSRKIVAEGRKYTIEEVSKIFSDAGCHLLSENYSNNKELLDYVCSCGEEDKKALSNFLLGQRCKECGIKKQAHSNRTPYEEVKRIFEDAGCQLISETFIHSNVPLDYICECGNKSRIKLPAFKYGVRCRGCGGNEKYTIEEVREVFEEAGCTLLSTEYLGTHKKLRYICACEEEAYVTFYKFRNSAYKRCRSCSDKLNGERIRGDKHPHWNPSISDKDRIDRRLDNRNKKWRYEVYKRDNFSCVICGEKNGDLNAHHKDGYHWCEERRYDVSNGVTLCTEHHLEYHRIYGYKNTIEKDWNSYYASKISWSERRLGMSE